MAEQKGQWNGTVGHGHYAVFVKQVSAQVRMAHKQNRPAYRRIG